jgi:glycine/D-amino acid oxidase-like deaminating enzyme/nitrite reductase/ring-hydroxylating ferredoxin subunit
MINRDGNNTSLWQPAVEAYVPATKADLKKVYDVIIVGGGITGISTALLLQKAGKQCLVLESDNLCFGTTGGTTAHLNTLLDTPYTTIAKNFSDEKAKGVAASTKAAIGLIRQHVDLYNIDCGFTQTDAFLFAQDEKQEKELEDIRKATTEAGVEAMYEPQLPPPFISTKSIRVPGQAKFIPTRYVFALAKAFENAGGSILQQCRVTGAEDNETITVNTSMGDISGKSLIYATHIPPGVSLLHLRCAPYRSYAMAVTLKDGMSYPNGLFYDMYDPYHYYRTQEIDGQSYLIVGGYDHKTAQEENTDRCFAELEAHIRQLFDVKEVTHKWSSQYFEPADGLPYIGSLPGRTGNIYVATGYGGNGMTYSSVAAILLSELIVTGKSEYADLYDPNRLKPVAGFVNFIKHNAAVVRDFAGKWLPHEELNTLAELAPGEAKVIRYQDQKIALYKDENGSLHAVDPICTHMKCEVKWNMTEKSWDCPCHGARYSFEGKVITGPADHDLEPIELRSLTNSEK